MDFVYCMIASFVLIGLFHANIYVQFLSKKSKKQEVKYYRYDFKYFNTVTNEWVTGRDVAKENPTKVKSAINWPPIEYSNVVEIDYDEYEYYKQLNENYY